MALHRFFIVGCPRSGTTMLQQAHNRHSQVAIPPEAAFVSLLGLSKTLQHEHLRRISEDLEIDLPAPASRLHRAPEARAYYEMMAQLYVGRLGKPGVTHFGDKTPEHLRQLPQIHRLLPNAKVILIFRDGRDVALSLGSLPWTSRDLYVNFALWLYCYRLQRRAQRSCGLPLLCILYEDLVKDPGKELPRILAFLGLPYEAQVIEGEGNTAGIPTWEFCLPPGRRDSQRKHERNMGKSEAIGLAAALMFGAGLRFHSMEAKSLWFDEALSWQLLQFSWGEMIAPTGEPYTTHPPIYFILLRLWGDTEVVLRSLSGLAGLGIVLGSYALVRELGSFPRSHLPTSREVTVCAAMLVALSPVHIRLSHQVRSYAFSTLLYTCGGLFLLGVLRTGRQVAWMLFAGAVLLLCYTHHLAFFQMPAWILFALLYQFTEWQRQRRPPGDAAEPPALEVWGQVEKLLLVGIVIILDYRPWLYRLVSQVSTSSKAWSEQTDLLKAVEQTYLALTTSYARQPPTVPWWLATHFITTKELYDVPAGGLWLITSDSYSPGQQHWFPIPEHWSLKSTKEFPQGDYHWENPITVEHYVIANASLGGGAARRW